MWLLALACTGDDSGDDSVQQGFIYGQVLGLAGAVDARNTAVIDDYAYVCAGPEGIYQFDVRDPTNPQYLDTLFIRGQCMDMIGLIQTLYVAAGTSGFMVVEPDPMLVSGEYIPENDYQVMHVGIDPVYDFAYLAEWNESSARIERVDIKIPDLPKVDVTQGAGSLAPGDLHESNERVFYAHSDGAIDIYDIWLNEEGSREPTFTGSGSIDLHHDDDFLYSLLGDSGLTSVRVTDPAYPADVHVFDMDGRAIHSVTVTDGDRLYVAAEGAIGVFDISDPFEPKLVNDDLILISNLKEPVDITVAHGVAYVADEADDNLILVNVDENDL